MKNPARPPSPRPAVPAPAPERFALALVLVLVLATHAANAAGIVTHLSGTLTVRQAEGPVKLLSVKSAVDEGDTLATQEGTYARIKFDDGGELVLRPNSQLTVAAYRFRQAEPDADSAVLALLKGGMRTVTGFLGKRNPNRVSVTTATATIGIRGTHFGLLMCQGDCLDIPTLTGKPPEDGLHIDVADGAIQVANRAGQQVIGAGQFGYVGSAASAPVIVPASQGIQVTMPDHISRNNTGGNSVGKSRESAECAVP